MKGGREGRKQSVVKKMSFYRSWSFGSALLLLLQLLIIMIQTINAQINDVDFKILPAEKCGENGQEGKLCCLYKCPQNKGLKKKFCQECKRNEFCTLDEDISPYQPDAHGNC
jgi:hypothetical protein